MILKEIDACCIKDSRNEQTIEVSVETADGKFSASAPSGKSKGKYEAQAFSSKGIAFSLAFVKAVGKKLSHDVVEFNEFEDLKKIEELAKKADKSENWQNIGANSLYALESALLKAIAASHGKELWQFLCENPRRLPLPLGNVIGGGMHVEQETKADIQEFLLLPRTNHFFDAYFINLQAYKIAKKLVLEKDKRYENKLTDEHALASTLENEQVFTLLLEVKKQVEEKFRISLSLGVDIAASTFFRKRYYEYFNPRKRLNREEQIKYVLELIKKYGLVYVEDPLEENDFSGFSKILKEIEKKDLGCMLTGDDLTATQFSRVEKAVKEKAINALIVKPNQNGSLLETKRIIDYAKENGITCIISHRSAETLDNTIAHLAVGWQLPIIKTGILGKERFAKLHEILRIERSLGKNKY